MRLASSAQKHGGMAEPTFVTYHEEVDEDSDAPVEVCAPIGLAHEPPDNVASRREPSRREAYARITKSPVDFPQILSAYDAVAQWIGAHGRHIADSPREVYFGD